MGVLTYKEKQVIDYFYQKNIWRQGFLKYAFFSRKIKFLFGNDMTVYERKKLFDNLIKKDYFIVQYRDINKSKKMLYQLRNNLIKNKQETYTIIFD